MFILRQYLLLRLRLIYRSLGNHRQAIGLVLLALFSTLAYSLFKVKDLSDNHVWIMIGIVFISILQYHLNRKDRDYLLESVGKRTTTLLIGIEYLLLSVPIIIILALKGYYMVLLLLAIPLLLPIIPTRSFRRNNHISIFGKGNVEWNAGFRSTSIFTIPLLLIFVTTCVLQLNNILSMILLAILLLSFTSFYSVHEHENMIIAYSSSGELLNSKIRFLVKSFFPIAIILSIILILFYGEFSWYPLMILGQAFTLCLTYLLLKYMYYPSKLASELQLSILSILTIIPFTAPIILISCIYFYQRAKKNLNPYFL